MTAPTQRTGNHPRAESPASGMPLSRWTAKPFKDLSQPEPGWHWFNASRTNSGLCLIAGRATPRVPKEPCSPLSCRSPRWVRDRLGNDSPGHLLRQGRWRRPALPYSPAESANLVKAGPLQSSARHSAAPGQSGELSVLVWLQEGDAKAEGDRTPRPRIANAIWCPVAMSHRRRNRGADDGHRGGTGDRVAPQPGMRRIRECASVGAVGMQAAM